MADNNTYVIKFDISNLAENDGAVANSNTNATTDDGADNPLNVGDAYNAVKKATFGLVSFATAKSFADQIAGFEISQVSLRTGANEYEQRLNMTYQVASGVIGSGAALLGGAIFGGPVGLAAAAAGVVLSGVHKLVAINQRQQELDTQTALEDVSIGSARRRAGFTGSRSFNQ